MVRLLMVLWSVRILVRMHHVLRLSGCRPRCRHHGSSVLLHRRELEHIRIGWKAHSLCQYLLSHWPRVRR